MLRHAALFFGLIAVREAREVIGHPTPRTESPTLVTFKIAHIRVIARASHAGLAADYARRPIEATAATIPSL